MKVQIILKRKKDYLLLLLACLFLQSCSVGNVSPIENMETIIYDVDVVERV